MINREVKYERNMSGSYMKIPVGIQAGLDEKLILRRKLQGVLPVEKTYVDGVGQYWYNISGKQSLDTYCRVKQIGIDFVEKLVVSICSEMEVLEWNLVDAGCLMLDPELIFITNANQEVIFTLYPGSNARIETEFQQLMEYMLTKIDHKDEAAVRAAYTIYERTLEESYSIMDIRETIMRAKQQEREETADRQLEAEGKGPDRERGIRSQIVGRGRKEAEPRYGALKSADAAEHRKAEPGSRAWGDREERKETLPRRGVWKHADGKKHGEADRAGGVWNGADRKKHREKDREHGIQRDTERRREEDWKSEKKQNREKDRSIGAKTQSIWSRGLNYVKSQLGFTDDPSASYTGTHIQGINKKRAAADYERDYGLVYPEEEIYEPQEEIHPTVCLSSYPDTPRGILVYLGVEQLGDIPLELQTTRIGYGKEADARIEQDTISQMHARIDRDGDNYYIEDLNSTNGTYVNDELLVYKEKRQLKVNDLVCFANLRYRFC